MRRAEHAQRQCVMREASTTADCVSHHRRRAKHRHIISKAYWHEAVASCQPHHLVAEQPAVFSAAFAEVSRSVACKLNFSSCIAWNSPHLPTPSVETVVNAALPSRLHRTHSSHRLSISFAFSHPASWLLRARVRALPPCLSRRAREKCPQTMAASLHAMHGIQ